MEKPAVDGAGAGAGAVETVVVAAAADDARGPCADFPQFLLLASPLLCQRSGCTNLLCPAFKDSAC